MLLQRDRLKLWFVCVCMRDLKVVLMREALLMLRAGAAFTQHIGMFGMRERLRCGLWMGSGLLCHCFFCSKELTSPNLPAYQNKNSALTCKVVQSSCILWKEMCHVCLNQQICSHHNTIKLFLHGSRFKKNTIHYTRMGGSLCHLNVSKKTISMSWFQHSGSDMVKAEHLWKFPTKGCNEDHLVKLNIKTFQTTDRF